MLVLESVLLVLLLPGQSRGLDGTWAEVLSQPFPLEVPDLLPTPVSSHGSGPFFFQGKRCATCPATRRDTEGASEPALQRTSTCRVVVVVVQILKLKTVLR